MALVAGTLFVAVVIVVTTGILATTTAAHADWRRETIDVVSLATFAIAAIAGAAYAVGYVISREIRSRNLADRERAERAETLLHDAIDSISEGFVIYDAEDRLVMCNEAYRRAYPLTAPAIVPGASFTDILRYGLARGEYRHAVGREAEWLEERLRRHRAASSAVEQALSDGRHILVVEHRTASGHTAGLRLDVTALRKAEEEQRRAEKVAAELAQADAANKAKSEFLASMSHELRTPLNAILGFAQVLRDPAFDPLTERQQEYLGYVVESGERLLRLTNDILDLAKIENDKLPFVIETVDVSPLLREIRRTLEPLAVEKAVRLSVRAPDPQTLAVRADYARLLQVLLNLGSNAIKYNRPNGEVAIGAAMPDTALIRITVEDTGFGIPLDRQGDLFQIFSRAGMENGKIGGSGLGLTLTKKLVLAMDGQIGFESTPGVGSRFWVDLPVAKRAPELRLAS